MSVSFIYLFTKKYFRTSWIYFNVFVRSSPQKPTFWCTTKITLNNLKGFYVDICRNWLIQVSSHWRKKKGIEILNPSKDGWEKPYFYMYLSLSLDRWSTHFYYTQEQKSSNHVPVAIHLCLTQDSVLRWIDLFPPRRLSGDFTYQYKDTLQDSLTYWFHDGWVLLIHRPFLCQER